MGALATAWELWSTGKLPDSHVLWGLEIFWWGRIGKVLQAFALVTVVVEIIGPVRLRNFGTRLHKAMSWKMIKMLVSDAGHYRESWKRFMASEDGTPEEDKELERQESLSSNTLHVILLALVIAVFGVVAWRAFEWWLAILVATFAFGLYAWISAYVTTAVLILILSIGWLLDAILVKPTAYVLTRRHLDKLLKLVALLSAVLGLHFDFLAS